MKDERVISSGNRIKKRQNYDDLIRNFHKKLKLDDNCVENKPTPTKSTSNALVLYKKPIQGLISNTVPKYILQNIDKPILLPNFPISSSKNCLKIDQLFKEDAEENELKIDEKNNEMMLD